jgi:hypothetical protein
VSITVLGVYKAFQCADRLARYYNTTVQLSAGVRLVTGQIHQNNNEWHLCHTSCSLLDAGTLEAWLSEIKTWLDNNPNDGNAVLLTPER